MTDSLNEEPRQGSGPTDGVRNNPDATRRDRQTDDALALFAHELRNPLGVIRMAVQLLRMGRDDPATYPRVESLLDQQTSRMSRLIDGMLDLSRIGRGTVQLVTERMELSEFVNLAIEAVRPCMEERGHELEVLLPAGPVFLDADPTRLEEVLTNLLENAAKFTDSGGRLVLRAMPEKNDIVLRVQDSGIGIAAGLLPHIFDLFRQSSRALNHSRGGLGIGLALVRKIVELHGGSVTALSAGPGLGSEFVVRLPQIGSIQNGAVHADEGSMEVRR
jgi:signal transduction histidine kinase